MSPNRVFDPIKIGNLHLQHRIPMAPLTRFRASDEHVPGPLMQEYYEQRACVPGTLLISEATLISPRASGYRNVPGIWSRAQIEGWKKVTQAVHARGSFIYCQLWALGRVATEKVLKEEGDYEILSSSAIAIPGETSTGSIPGKPKAMSESQIQEFIADYAQAAKNAIEAGFDGVEIHGANGYLIDQFTQEVVNQRTDRYGGSIENRARFGTEVAKAVVDSIGAARTAIRLAPFYEGQGMGLKDPIPQYLYLTKKLRELDLAYLHLVDRRTGGTGPGDAIYNEISTDNDELIEEWCRDGKPLVLAGGYTLEKATKLLNDVHPSKEIATAFGRYFISNPDLVFRMRKGIELNRWQRETFYKAKSPDGYTDIPFSTEWTESQSRL